LNLTKKKHIIFEEKIEIDTEVNTLDPIKAWKIRTVDIEFETKNGRFTHKVKEQLKKKNIPTYSTILKINDSKCDIMQNKCSDGRGFSNLRNTNTLLIGYHENKNKIWVIEDGDHDKTWIIIFATLLIVMVIMAIVYRCWCVPKKNHIRKKIQTLMTMKEKIPLHNEHIKIQASAISMPTLVERRLSQTPFMQVTLKICNVELKY